MKPRIAAGLSLLSVLMAVPLVGLRLILESESSYEPTLSLDDVFGDIVLSLAFTLVGGLIGVKRPANLVGWALLLSGMGLLAGDLLGAYGELAVLAEPERRLPAGIALAVIGSGAWVPLMAGVFLLLILFPNGEIASSRWRLVTRLLMVAFGLVWLGIATRPTLDPPFDGIDNPLAFTTARSYNWLPFLLIVPCLLAIVAAAIRQLIRFRRSSGDEREQYK